MASEPPRRVVDPLVGPQHYVPSTPRELRAQAVQRLQTGLFGLAAIVLMVGLANIINDRARLAEGKPEGVVAKTAEQADGNADPLADAGVVPSATPEPAASAAAGTQGN